MALVALLPAEMAMAGGAPSIAAMRWKQRPLLVFAPAGDARLTRQRNVVQDAAAGYDERDLRVVTISENTVSGSSDAADALRHRYHVDRQAFAVILVGKDGGEKLRSAEPLPADRLFETIDAMPMRRDEMHR